MISHINDDISPRSAIEPLAIDLHALAAHRTKGS